MEQQPRERRRRSDRYLTEPETAPERFAAPPPVPAPQSLRPDTLPDTLPDGLPDKNAEDFPGRREAARERITVHTRRRRAETEEEEERPRKLPAWMTVTIAALALASLACFTVQSLTRAKLTQHRQAKEAAYQRIVDAHPVYYQDWIERYAAENNLQPAFVEAIILNESSYDPKATSGVGARGLMQLMPDTAEWIAQKMGIGDYSFEDMYDPETNIRFGTWYLRFLSGLFGGDPVAVTCAYHAGQNTVLGWQSTAAYLGEDGLLELGRLPEGPTKSYAGRVTRDYAIYQALLYPAPGSLWALPDAADGESPG